MVYKALINRFPQIVRMELRHIDAGTLHTSLQNNPRGCIVIYVTNLFLSGRYSVLLIVISATSAASGLHRGSSRYIFV